MVDLTEKRKFFLNIQAKIFFREENAGSKMKVIFSRNFRKFYAHFCKYLETKSQAWLIYPRQIAGQMSEIGFLEPMTILTRN